MIIKHQVIFSENDKKRSIFEELEVCITKAGNIYSFIIMENDALWPEVSRKLEKENIQSMAVAEFSKKEILSANKILEVL